MSWGDVWVGDVWVGGVWVGDVHLGDSRWEIPGEMSRWVMS